MAKTIFASRLGMPVLAIVACAAAVMASYCGKKEEEVTVEAKYSSIYKNVLASCATCHVPGHADYEQKVHNLDFSSEKVAYESLTSVPDITGKSECNEKYVVAQNSAKSLLWAVLDNTTRENFPSVVTNCSVIPESVHGMGEISAQARSAIKQWIDAGAANN